MRIGEGGGAGVEVGLGWCPWGRRCWKDQVVEAEEQEVSWGRQRGLDLGWGALGEVSWWCWAGGEGGGVGGGKQDPRECLKWWKVSAVQRQWPAGSRPGQVMQKTEEGEKEKRQWQ